MTPEVRASLEWAYKELKYLISLIEPLPISNRYSEEMQKIKNLLNKK